MYNVYNQPSQDFQADSVREGLGVMVSRFGLSQTLSYLGISKTKYTMIHDLGIRGAKDLPVLRKLYRFGVWPRPDEYTEWGAAARDRHLVFSFSWLDKNTYPIPGETVIAQSPRRLSGGSAGQEYYWPTIYDPQKGTFERWKAAIEHDISLAPEALLALAEVFYGLIAQSAMAKEISAWYEDYCLPAVHFWGPDPINLRNMLVMASSILPERPSPGLMPWYPLKSAGIRLCPWEMENPRFKVWEPWLYLNDAGYKSDRIGRSGPWDDMLPTPPFIFAQDGAGHHRRSPECCSPNLSSKMVSEQIRVLHLFANRHSAALTCGSRPYLELFERDKYFLWSDAARIIDIEVPLWKNDLRTDLYLENYGHAAFVLAAYLNKEEIRPFNAASPQTRNRGWEQTDWKQYEFARLHWALCVAKDAGVIDFPEDYIQSVVTESFMHWQKEAAYQWKKWGRKNYDVYINNRRCSVAVWKQERGL